MGRWTLGKGEPTCRRPGQAGRVCKQFSIFLHSQDTEAQHQLVQEKQLNPALPCQEDEELCVLLEVRCATCSLNLNPHLEVQPRQQKVTAVNSSVLRHQHCHQYFSAPLHGTAKDNNLLFITISFTSQKKAETILC